MHRKSAIELRTKSWWNNASFALNPIENVLHQNSGLIAKCVARIQATNKTKTLLFKTKKKIFLKICKCCSIVSLNKYPNKKQIHHFRIAFINSRRNQNSANK